MKIWLNIPKYSIPSSSTNIFGGDGALRLKSSANDDLFPSFALITYRADLLKTCGGREERCLGPAEFSGDLAMVGFFVIFYLDVSVEVRLSCSEIL